jgi:hypothetical protein
LFKIHTGRVWIAALVITMSLQQIPAQAAPAAPAISPTASRASATAPGWAEMDLPDTHKGLVLEPRLMHLRGRVFIFWAGTSLEALNPEIFLATREGKDAKWKTTKAPFFGQDVGKVHHLAVATARDQMAMIFQRSANQGNRAVEVQMSTSRDFGWSWSPPFVLDSYTLGETGGSGVALAARQGASRPEFAGAWIAENGIVRAANLDGRSSFRPTASKVGEVKDQDGQVEVVGNGTDGFYVVWPEDHELRSAHVKPLTGGVEEKEVVTTGTFKKDFSVCSNYHGPAHIVAESERNQLTSFVPKGGKFVPDGETVTSPIPGRNLESRSSVDGDNGLHVATLDSHNVNKLYYMGEKKGKGWSAPELVLDLDPSIPVTGFDIVATDDAVWICASQGQLLYIRKKKIR